MAYYLAKEKATANFETFFATLKPKCGALCTENFISDDYPAYYNAFVKIFGTNAVKHKSLCYFHVQKNWKNEKLKIKASEPVEAELVEQIKSTLTRKLSDMCEETFLEIYEEKKEELLDYLRLIVQRTDLKQSLEGFKRFKRYFFIIFD